MNPQRLPVITSLKNDNTCLHLVGDLKQRLVESISVVLHSPTIHMRQARCFFDFWNKRKFWFKLSNTPSRGTSGPIIVLGDVWRIGNNNIERLAT